LTTIKAAIDWQAMMIAGSGQGDGDAASAAPGDALAALPTPMIGEVVYDADADKVGDVTEIIFDSEGNVAQIVIGIGDFSRER